MYICSGEGTILTDDYKSDKNIIVSRIENDKIYFLMKINAVSFNDAEEGVERYVWKKGILNPIINGIVVEG